MIITSNQAKYRSKNIFIRYGVRRFSKDINWILSQINFGSIIDVGCGEGYVSRYLRNYCAREKFILGIDNNYNALEVAHSHCVYNALVQAGISRIPVKAEAFDLVLCTEVLEHVRFIDNALLELKRIAKRYCLFSVPWEGQLRLCRILGLKNVAGMGRHPDHVHQFNMDSFSELIERYFKIEVLRISFPWIIILGSKSQLSKLGKTELLL